MSQSTIAIFKIFHNQLPPLVPDDILSAMENSVNNFENNKDAPVKEVEDAMINFGYKVWPWRRAYREFFDEHEKQIGEHFFMPRLSDDLKKKCGNYNNYGLGWKEIHSGRPAEYFTPEERVELNAGLADTARDLHDYVRREVCGMSREKYLRKVDECAGLLDDIREHLDELRNMACRAEEHENLANEIKAKIRAFEYGLCLLGPEIEHNDIEKAVEFFHGRRHDLNRLRGVHLPVEVDFYSA